MGGQGRGEGAALGRMGRMRMGGQGKMLCRALL